MKTELHPRNKHRDLYNFKQLIQNCHELANFVSFNKYGNQSIDFTNPIAVKTLNKAILQTYYNIIWDIPEYYLCPPIPNRVDYIHYIADLLSTSNTEEIPKGKDILVLDIGVGANCIYPLLGHREYGWSFIATDIDPIALSIANEIIEKNKLTEFIELRLQKSPKHIFESVIIPSDPLIDVCICNPPFHRSLKEANSGTQRKWNNLKIQSNALNFGGRNNELFCTGGEVTFITNMINESIHVKCKWFTTLVSKASNLPRIYHALDQIKASKVKTINMGQGQKKSRIVAWTFDQINVL